MEHRFSILLFYMISYVNAIPTLFNISYLKNCYISNFTCFKFDNFNKNISKYIFHKNQLSESENIFRKKNRKLKVRLRYCSSPVEKFEDHQFLDDNEPLIF